MMTKPSAGIFLLTVLLTLQVHAGGRLQCEHIFNDSQAPTERVLKNKFVTNRGLWDYEVYLHPGFREKLKTLSSEQHWIDLGAGKAKAQSDFLGNFTDPRLAPKSTAVCFKLDRWFGVPHFQGKLEVKEGMFEKHDTKSWAKADLISDFFGVLSYTRDMTTSLQKTFDLLKVGGELYLHSTNYVTGIRTAKGESLTLTEFLRTIEGLQVEGNYGNLKITKLQEEILIPEMELSKYKDDAPPVRHFAIKSAEQRQFSPEDLVVQYQKVGLGVNHYLRTGNELFIEHLPQVDGKMFIRGMDALIASRPVGQEMILYRGEAHATEAVIPKVGDTLTREGYVSTTSAPEIAKVFAKGKVGIVFQIRVREGMHALDISAYAKDKSESEFLLPRGSHFLVRKVSREGDLWLIEVDQVTYRF